MGHVEVHRTEHPKWLSNAYLVINRDDALGVLVDGNGVSRPLLERIETENIEVSAILLTHHHFDHIDVRAYRHLGAPVLAHPETASLADMPRLVDEVLGDAEMLHLAGMDVLALYTPGHAADHIAVLIDGDQCFSADVLFRGTVGGTRGSAATGIDDLRRSIERLLELGLETTLHPGHGLPTTVADELATNSFVRAWCRNDVSAGEPCTVAGDPADLLLWGPDYDGTHKAWVRFSDGSEHIVGGSQVARQAAR